MNHVTISFSAASCSLGFHNHINGPDLTEIRKEAASKGGLRGVMIIRDPLDMLASAYCYYSAGWIVRKCQEPFLHLVCTSVHRNILYSPGLYIANI